MGKIRMMFAAAALAVCTGTAYGQVLDVAPVGDAVMPDGRRVYAMPQTTVVVDITVARESVVTGPYARFAQKYLGVIAPLADKETYTLRSAVVSRYDPVVTRDLNPGPIPAPHTEIYADTGSAEEFPRVLPDRRSASGSSLENAARDAAQTIFDLRSRRTELITGDYAETVYGAGLATAVERIDRMENEYLELFFGKRSVTTYTVRYYVVPDAEGRTFVVCRFRDDRGLLPADDLSGEPVVLECRPQGVAVTAYPPQRKRTPRSDEAEYAVADMTDCRVMFDRTELGNAVLPVYQYGVRTILPVR